MTKKSLFGILFALVFLTALAPVAFAQGPDGDGRVILANGSNMTPDPRWAYPEPLVRVGGNSAAVRLVAAQSCGQPWDAEFNGDLAHVDVVRVCYVVEDGVVRFYGGDVWGGRAADLGPSDPYGRLTVEMTVNGESKSYTYNPRYEGRQLLEWEFELGAEIFVGSYNYEGRQSNCHNWAGEGEGTFTVVPQPTISAYADCFSQPTIELATAEAGVVTYRFEAKNGDHVVVVEGEKAVEAGNQTIALDWGEELDELGEYQFTYEVNFTGQSGQTAQDSGNLEQECAEESPDTGFICRLSGSSSIGPDGETTGIQYELSAVDPTTGEDVAIDGWEAVGDGWNFHLSSANGDRQPWQVEKPGTPGKYAIQGGVRVGTEWSRTVECRIELVVERQNDRTTVQVFVNGEQPYDEHTEYVDELGNLVVVPGVRDGKMPLADHQPTLDEVLASFGATSFPVFINDEGNGATKVSLRVIRLDIEETLDGGARLSAYRELDYLRTAIANPDGTIKEMIRFELDGAQWIVFQPGEHLDMSRVIWVPLSPIGGKVDLTCVRYQGGVWACGLDHFSDQPDNGAGLNDRGLHLAQVMTFEACRRGFTICNNALKAQLAREGEVNLWSQGGFGPWAEQMLGTLYGEVVYYDSRDYPDWVTLGEDGVSFTDHRSADEFQAGLQTLAAPPVPGEVGYGSPWDWANPAAK